MEVGSAVCSRATPSVEAVDLYRFYHAGDDETLALRGVSLTVMPGEIVAVVGPSGSGKSTLLACLAGLDDPDGGSVRIRGQLISRQAEGVRARIRAADIGVLLQHGNLLEHLNVVENVQLAAALSSARPTRTARDLLAIVGLSGKIFARPARLSGGEAARAGLAVALASDPALLLADEPTGEVDAENETAIERLLLGERERGTAVVVVTHSTRVAAAADRVIKLRDGVIVDG